MGKYVFIHRGGPEMASYRYRAMMPAAQVGGTVNGGDAQVLIFSKPTPDDLVLAKDNKEHGVKIVADLGDDHFNHAIWGPIYREMVRLADCVVTPTNNMAARIKTYTGRTVDAVIADPYEEALQPPHANGAEKYLWFGNPVNLKDLTQWKPHLKDLDLTIVKTSNHKLEFDYLTWSPEVQTAQLGKANVVILPTRKGAEYKSANRLVNAVRAGCFVVASTHPSATEFRRFIWAGSFVTGLQWAKYFKDELNDMVREGQAYCEKFSPENIGTQWAQVLDAVAA